MARFTKDRWGSPEAYRPHGRDGTGRAMVVAVIAGAVIVGVSAGYFLGRPNSGASGKPDAPIEWNRVQAVPTRAPDAQDIEWRKRSEEADDGATAPAPAVRTAFGYCHVGGGINCVVDGDTFYRNGEKVRIAGIDAPETHPPRCDHEAQLGSEATKKLHDLLSRGAVTMTSIDRDRDVYGRLLRNVAVNGEDVGETMISAGVARDYGNGRRPWC